MYRQTSNISITLVGNKIADHSDAVGASPVGAAPTTSSLSTLNLASIDWAKTFEDETRKVWDLGIGVAYVRRFTVYLRLHVGAHLQFDTQYMPLHITVLFSNHL